MLNKKTARALATQIVRESSGVVKFGETNSRICLHVRFPEKSGAHSLLARSITVYGLQEWEDVPFPYNETKRHKTNESDSDETPVEA